MTQTFFKNSFQNDEEWHLFYCNNILGWQVIQDYANTCDLTTWTQNYVKSQNMDYLCQYYVYRVDVLQELHTVIVVMMSP